MLHAIVSANQIAPGFPFLIPFTRYLANVKVNRNTPEKRCHCALCSTVLKRCGSAVAATTVRTFDVGLCSSSVVIGCGGPTSPRIILAPFAAIRRHDDVIGLVWRHSYVIGLILDEIFVVFTLQHIGCSCCCCRCWWWIRFASILSCSSCFSSGRILCQYSQNDELYREVSTMAHFSIFVRLITFSNFFSLSES